jgi:ribulose-5-phosphate 4-epimerase/fuculose-1-phosphate aldolase
MVESLDELKETTAQAHRILTMTNSMGDTTGHVMVRVPGKDQVLLRCRGEDDWSPGFARPEAMHVVDLDGNPAEAMGGYLPPPERHIACAILKARPDVNCVIHAHPPAQILCSISGVEIRPIVGSANAGGMKLALGGLPVYARSILVASPEIAGAMLQDMGGRDICLLKAHGNVVVADSIEEATVRAIQIENLARICWQVAAAGRSAPDISPEDIAEFLDPQQPAAQAARDLQGGSRWVWNYYLRLLHEGGSTHVEMGADQP